MGALALGYGGAKANEAANQPGGKKNAPAPPDYMGLVREQGQIQQDLLNQQTRANRPNQSTPFASSTWSQGPDGQWTQSTALNGPMGEASTAVQKQLLQAMTNPLDFGSLPGVSSGDVARQQGIDAAYSQATSRLDPRFSRARESERTRLLNQGLAEGSEAFNNAMGQLGNQETDAYNQAMYSAIGQGREAGESIFRQDMARRNMAGQEMLQARRQPMADLQGFQSLLNMPGFMGAGQGQAPNLVGAGGMQDAANFRNWQSNNQATADAIGGGMDLLGMLGQMYFMSDERAKMELEELPHEVVPGVPAIAFRYRPELGLGNGRYVGVSAQALQRVHPEAVRERPDGLLEVSAKFAPVPLEEP
jgi:hypothetical protein